MNPRQRRGLLLIAVSILGLLGVFVLVAGYVADVREQIEPKVRLLAIAQAVQEQEAITDEMIKTVEMPERWAPPTAIRDRGRLAGVVASSNIPKDSILQEGMLEPPPELEAGQREIAILVDAETGVAGKVGPGSVVDIVATFAATNEGARAESRVVVSGVRVVEVGQARLDGGRGVRETQSDPQQVVPVTFALSPSQVVQVTYAESFASEVRLSLLRPGEASVLTPKERVYRKRGR